MTTLDTNELTFEIKKLHEPSLDEIKTVISSGLTSNFQEVSVSIIDCPNLEEAPFHLAAKGICGSSNLIDIGGPPYLLPLVDRTKLYDIPSICRKVLPSESKLLAIGAGAGPYPLVNSNCEGIFNVALNENGTIINQSHLAKVEQPGETCSLQKFPDDETRFALLGNIHLSEGKPGKVVRVNCKQRIGKDDFITSIRKCLASHYKNQAVGLGGLFLLKKGKAKQHVMRDFSVTPIRTEDELNNWLKFYDMPAILIALGTLITEDLDLDLRLQHFHSFSKNGWGGHYHNDVTPDIVEYEGYFTVAEQIVRVDKPIVTHQFGRD